MTYSKPIGAPWSMARWCQQRDELFELIGAKMLAIGLDPTQEQTIAIVDDLMKHVYGPYPVFRT